MSRIKILRLSRSSQIIFGGDVFEQNFIHTLNKTCELESQFHVEWLDKVMGPIEAPFSVEKSADNFREIMEAFDFFSPNYELNTIVPWLVYLRNKGHARVKLLMIAHSPGIYLFEWAMLPHVLRSGDVIVAPSHNAKALITSLCPDLEPFVHVIPHPIPQPGIPLKKKGTRRTKRIVSLARINGDKLIHRQIEALGLMKEQGLEVPEFQIAGFFGDPEPSPYARSLLVKIERLGLKDKVRLIGPIRDKQEKEAWLAEADLLVNLSVTLEESFGKAPAEALCLGVPVLVTHWNGLTETAGKGGEAVPVKMTQDFMPDVDPKDLMDATRRLLENPPSVESCLEEAKRFDPDIISGEYEELLQKMLDQPTVARKQENLFGNHQTLAPDRGIYSDWVPLKAISVSQAFSWHWDQLSAFRQVLMGDTHILQHLEMAFRVILMRASLYPLACFFSGNRLPKSSRGAEHLNLPESWFSNPIETPEDLAQHLVKAATMVGDASSRVSSLFFVHEAGVTEALEEGLQALNQNEVHGPGVIYLRVEVALAKKRYQEAFDLCTRQLDCESPRETQATQIRQLAKICRLWGRAELAIPWLNNWTRAFPDSPEAGLIWLTLSFTAANAGGDIKKIAPDALSQAIQLMGENPVTKKVAQLI